MNENNKSPVSAQFKKDMDSVISHWKKEQENFYKSIENEITQLGMSQSNPKIQSILGRISYDTFPKFLRWGVFTNQDASVTIDPSYLISRINQIGGTHKEKGINFEDIAALALNNSILKKLGNVIGLSLQHTGSQHLREDFELKDRFTFDAKFTSNVNPEDPAKYRNIVKEYGSSLYASIHQIEDNIVRSLYSEGAIVGDIHAKQNKDKAIYSLTKDKKTGLTTFEELDKKARKILIYLYPENGYWASDCLEKVVEWAVKRMDDTQWRNLNTRAGEKATDNYLHTYQGFWYNNK